MFDYIDRLVVVSLFPYIKKDWNLSDAQLGLSISAVYWSIRVIVRRCRCICFGHHHVALIPGFTARMIALMEFLANMFGGVDIDGPNFCIHQNRCAFGQLLDQLILKFLELFRVFWTAC